MVNREETRPSRGIRLLIGFVLLVFTLAIVEAGFYGIGRILQERHLMYRVPVPPPNRTVATYEEYLAIRDPILGWPFTSEFDGERYDIAGSRHIPAFEDPHRHKNCVSLYGDSFTLGAEVDHEHAWSNHLSQLLGCRVANFGVGSYGPDQAYLRFGQNEQDAASVVVLGYLSENIYRNLTRSRDLQGGYMWYSLKPRFILDVHGELELVPIPRLSEEEYHRLVGLESPQLVLEHENFHPGGPTGATKLRFPFTYSVLRNLRYYRMRAKLARRPPYAEFYTVHHPLGGLEITTEIIESFVRDAIQKGKQPIVVVFVTKSDLIHYKRTGKWSYQNLLDELDKNDIGYLDFGPHLVEYLGRRGLDEIFKPDGHYNEEGNRLVAEFVLAHLEQ